MIMLILVLVAAYVTVMAIVTVGFGLLMRRTNGNVAAVFRAEAWRLQRAARSASSQGQSPGALIGTGGRSR